MSGQFNPAPFQFGGEAGKSLEAIFDALLEGDGTALTKEKDSFVYAENIALARAVHDLWKAITRLSYQWDPDKMTDFLPRWEKIMGLNPLPNDTIVDRRMRVKVKFSLYGESPTQQIIEDSLSMLLGELFVGIERTDSTNSYGTYPGGLTVPGGVNLLDGAFSSKISYIAIQTQKPSAVSYQEYYDRVSLIHRLLKDILPAFTDFDWFLDGPNGAGFYLDEDPNLDNQRFSP